jgi:hypothetical protein
MADEQPNKETKVTPKGAVEMDEKDLDRAEGGASTGDDAPTESISLNFAKAEIDYARKAGGDPQLSPEKKI